MPPDTPLPCSRTLYRLLEGVTEALARQVADPATRLPGDWQATEWSFARAIAVMQGISPLLASQNVGEEPQGWRLFLEDQRRHTALRHARLMATAARIDVKARDAGIRLVALKGTELHRLGVYESGERPMADIDLLADAGAYTQAVEVLEGLGFTGGVEGWKDHLFVDNHAALLPVLGEHWANPVKIELHRHIVERLPWNIVSLPVRLLLDAAKPGLNSYRSKAALMTHLLLHAAGAMPTRTLRMIQLCDLARLARQLRRADWDEMLLTAASNDLWWAYPPIALTTRYYPHAIPADVIDAFRDRCPTRLVIHAQRMRLFEASHSYPWVEAFPGIGWSRTWRERGAYAANRIRPSRQVQAKRRTLATTEAWSNRDWSRRSQWQRVLRYLGGPQPRPSTMHAVRLALGVPA